MRCETEVVRNSIVADAVPALPPIPLASLATSVPALSVQLESEASAPDEPFTCGAGIAQGALKWCWAVGVHALLAGRIRSRAGP